MNLDWINSFIVLAHTENFSRSAEILKCSQPSVPRQIRLLEAHLKFQLFFRNQREVRLTEKGREFF